MTIVAKIIIEKCSQIERFIKIRKSLLKTKVWSSEGKKAILLKDIERLEKELAYEKEMLAAVTFNGLN